jgi:eukaryotic-like serine/threonine-protein kinase
MLKTIEKYEILEELGHGGMATVYRARDTLLDRPVALKVMHPHLRGSREARARFRREAQGVARLRHPNVLEIYDCSGEDSEASFIATELLTGPTLRALADASGDMPAEVAASFAIEVCAALSAAHEKGLVHRDVKPENILVHQGERVKLTDFGIADMLDAQTMTATGQILGSPGHMAPEQVDGRDCDARSDVFSLGTVLYFLACGKLPFSGRNPHQILKRIAEGDYAPACRSKPSIGAELERIIDRALAHEPSARFQTASEFEGALRAFVASSLSESPEELVTAYLRHPVDVTRDVHKHVVRSLLARARAAQRTGQRGMTAELLDRVLNLEEGNAEALALIADSERGRARLRVATASAVGVVLAGLTVWASRSATIPETAIEEQTALGVETPQGTDAGQRLASGGAVGASELDASLSEVAPVTTRPTKRAPDGPQTSSPLEPRRVVFDFDPDNVRIAIDGAPPRQWGPNFLATELAPGPHEFDVESECCAARFRQDVPAGQGDFVLSRTLSNRPAIVIVETQGVPAAVELGDGLARGAANQALRVPLEGVERERELALTVRAEGYELHHESLRVRAGSVVSVPVSLVAAP